jgi:DNA-binding MarR family transcriptional regulator
MNHAVDPAMAEKGDPVLPRPAPDGKEECICFLLRSAARRASALYTRHLARIGLGLPQHSLIGMAAAFEKQNGRPATVTELARALDLDRTTLTRNIKPLVDSGLLSVDAAARGGRARAVRATFEGRAAYCAGVALWRQAQDEMIAGLRQDYPGLMRGLAAAIAAVPDRPSGTADRDF